jgi:hypothetical protein
VPGTKPWSHGEPYEVESKSAGQKGGKDNLWPEIRDLVKAGWTLRRLRDDDKYTKLTFLYEKAISNYVLALYAESRQEEIPENPQWKGWQEQLMEMTQNDRTITWVYDLPGGNGKTFLAKWAMRYQEALRLEMGKLTDIKYVYSRSLAPLVFFDVTRFYEDKMAWGFLENLKDGNYTSTKYKSRVVTFKPPKVVVFSNFEPKMWSEIDGVRKRVLSDDRWNIFELKSGTLTDQTPRLTMDMNTALAWKPPPQLGYGGAFGRGV